MPVPAVRRARVQRVYMEVMVYRYVSRSSSRWRVTSDVPEKTEGEYSRFSAALTATTRPFIFSRWRRRRHRRCGRVRCGDEAQGVVPLALTLRLILASIPLSRSPPVHVSPRITHLCPPAVCNDLEAVPLPRDCSETRQPRRATRQPRRAYAPPQFPSLDPPAQLCEGDLEELVETLT